MNLRHAFQVVCVVASVCAGEFGVAQEYPSKAIKIVVPNTAGSGPDVPARILAAGMSKIMGQSVVVENKPGAGGAIGLEYVAKQTPADGYTVGIISAQILAMMPITIKDLRFDPLKDLQPVIGFAEGRIVLISASTLPWKTFGEMVSYAKANPGKLNYAAPSTYVRLLVEVLLGDLRPSMTFIPYPSAAPFIQGLVSGDVHLGVLLEGQAAALGEKVHVLALTGDQRSQKFPSTPTYRELGHPMQGNSYTLYVRSGTPAEVVDKLYSAMSRLLEQPEIISQFANIGFEPTRDTSEVSARKLREQAKLLADLAKKSGIQPE